VVIALSGCAQLMLPSGRVMGWQRGRFVFSLKAQSAGKSVVVLFVQAPVCASIGSAQFTVSGSGIAFALDFSKSITACGVIPVQTG
jgi:hypothetical protein